jgi:hypothetical protein
MDSDPHFGKKVIFLYPPAVLDDVIESISQREFEVLACKDHEKLARYLDKKPGALVFINIDQGMKEPEWEAWIKERMKVQGGTSFGIITYNDNKMLAEKYLMSLGVSCGFIVMKVGAAKASEILLKMLEANEARGKRKYVRSNCWQSSAEYNVSMNGSLVRGPVLDISSVGMTVTFADCTPPKAGAKIRDIQLSLRGLRLTVDGIVYGARQDPQRGSIHILILDPASMDDVKRDKIRNYVRRSLQDCFEKELASY